MTEQVKFLLIPKKNFTRKILPYEVILEALCYKVNGHALIDNTLISNLINSEAMDDSHVLLELSDTKEKSAHSFTALKKVWFSTEESKALFFERSYQNFDINSLNCDVIARSKLSDTIDTIEIVIEPPAAIEQNKFLNQMMFSDGALALFHDALTLNEVQSKNLRENLSQCKNDIKAIVTLIDTPSDSDLENVIKRSFALLCLENGHNAGWNSSNVLEKVLDSVSEEFNNDTVYVKWREIALALLNNESVKDLPFNDNGIIVLRAILLVLLNPALENLEALKSQENFNIGERVYHAARSFISLRFGYSFLGQKERSLKNDKRELLQNFNAAFINNELAEFNFHDKNEISSQIEIFSEEVFLPKLTDEDTIQHDNIHEADTPNISTSINPDKSILLDLDYLSFESDLDIDNIYYNIIGLVPYSGFKLSLIENIHSKQISLCLIDLQTDSGIKKFKGKTATELLKIQSSLAEGERFEFDESGVYLRFQPKINSDIKSTILSALNYLSELNVYNLRKSTFK